jgi:hypothetical protein
VSEQNVVLGVVEAAWRDRRVQLSERVVPQLAERAGSDRLPAQVRDDETVRFQFRRSYLAQGRAERRM